MKRVYIKALVLVMAFILVFACGCMVVEPEKTNIYINIAIPEGNTDYEYYRGAARRFEEANAEIEYSSTKKGVFVDVIIASSESMKLEKQAYSGLNIYVTNEINGFHPYEWASKNYIIGVDDVFTTEFNDGGELITLKDKIDSSALHSCKDNYSQYCAVPHVSDIVGATYDANAFDRYGYYFADDKQDARAFYSSITQQTYYFTNPTYDVNVKTTNKSAGVDRLYNSVDDGLPTSMYELIALCELIKEEERYPFIASGEDSYKPDYLVQALMTSMLGYEESRAIMDLDGKIRVVTGYTDEPLFPGYPQEFPEIRKPIVTEVELTEETGYYASWALAKYYAEAFLNLSFLMEWWADISYVQNTTSEMAVRNFLYSGYDMALPESLILFESSRWYKDLENSREFDVFNKTYNWEGDNPRRLYWMSMPTMFDGKEKDADSRTTQTIQQVNPSYLVLANNVWDDTIKASVCRDFMRFLCSEDECEYYTLSTGFSKDFKCEVNKESMSNYGEYYASLEEVVYYANKVFYSSDTLTFRKSPEYFAGGKDDVRFFNYLEYLYTDELMGEVVYNRYVNAFDYFRYFKKPNLKFLFEQRLLDKESWIEVYGGYSSIGEYIDSYGNPVKFQK